MHRQLVQSWTANYQDGQALSHDLIVVPLLLLVIPGIVPAVRERRRVEEDGCTAPGESRATLPVEVTLPATGERSKGLRSEGLRTNKPNRGGRGLLVRASMRRHREQLTRSHPHATAVSL